MDDQHLDDQHLDDEIVGLNRSASRWIWAIGAVELLLSGCVITTLAAAATTPRQDLFERFREVYSPSEIRMFEQIYPLLPALAVTLLVCGAIPGVAYLILGFGVRAGHPTSMATALVLAVTQAIVLGVLLAAQLLGSIVAADPAAFTSGVLVLGTPVALLGAGIYRLILAQRKRREADELGTDPWNEPALSTPDPLRP